MDFSEKCAKDVDSAVKLALEDLQLSIDEVDVTVLEEPSRGFFGIGSKLALVRVEKKKKENRQTDLFHLPQDDLIDELKNLDVLSITPMDALNTLFRLREKARRL